MGFNGPAALKKLLAFTVDLLLKKHGLAKSLTTDLIIALRHVAVKCDTLLLKKDISLDTSSDLIIVIRYVEKIRLRSYIRTVEDVALQRNSATIYRMSKLHLDQT